MFSVSSLFNLLYRSPYLSGIFWWLLSQLFFFVYSSKLFVVLYLQNLAQAFAFFLALFAFLVVLTSGTSLYPCLDFNSGTHFSINFVNIIFIFDLDIWKLYSHSFKIIFGEIITGFGSSVSTKRCKGGLIIDFKLSERLSPAGMRVDSVTCWSRITSRKVSKSLNSLLSSSLVVLMFSLFFDGRFVSLINTVKFLASFSQMPKMNRSNELLFNSVEFGLR